MSFFKKLVALFRKPSRRATVDSITADFNRKVVQLRALSNAKVAEEQALESKLADARAKFLALEAQTKGKQKAALLEAEKAVAVAGKIEALLA